MNFPHLVLSQKTQKKIIMPKKLRKSIKICWSKLKKLHPPQYSNSLLSTCKYPKTPSFSLDRHVVVPENNHPDTNAATLADVDRFLCENFHSLYIDEHPNNAIVDHGIKPSDRFFVSPEQTSSSLLMTSASSLSSYAEAAAVAPQFESVAVTTLSNNPYHDFRKSMKKMIETKHFGEEGLDWDFLEELLFCYLELNDKAVHKYVLKAFANLCTGFQRKKNGSRRKKVYKDLVQT